MQRSKENRTGVRAGVAMLLLGLMLSFVISPLAASASGNSYSYRAGSQFSVLAQATGTAEATATATGTVAATPGVTLTVPVELTPTALSTAVITFTPGLTPVATSTVVESFTPAATMVAAETPMATATSQPAAATLPQTGGSGGGQNGLWIALFGVAMMVAGASTLVLAKRRR